MSVFESRKDPLQSDIVDTQRQALGSVSEDIEGAGALNTAATQAFLALLGQGGSSGLSSLGILGELTQTGLPVTQTDRFGAATDLANRNISDQVAAFSESLGPRGLRFGTDLFRGQGLIRTRGLEDLNRFIVGEEASALESGRNRQLQAAQLLAAIANQADIAALRPAELALGMQRPATQPSLFEQLLVAAAPAAAGAFAGGFGPGEAEVLQ